MDIRKKIGEMFIVGFDGLSVTKRLEKLITEHHIGGVILFARNIKNIGQVTRFCYKLQGIRKTVSDTPLFIAIDHEGGVVQRIIDGVTVLPGNMAIGSINSGDCAYAAGRIAALELMLLGINVNFAPVLDVCSNPDNPLTGVRSFGDDADKVSVFGKEMIIAMQKYGVVSCAKHFPGIGDVPVDSHIDLPRNNVSGDWLKKHALKPFIAAIKAHVKMIMPAHCMYPELTENKILPATLSANILTKLLRNELGYKGLIVTDDMEMGAIEKYYDLDESIPKAVDAGNDIILMCHTLGKQKKALKILIQNVLKGKISHERIEKSYERINTAKKDLITAQPRFNVVRDAIQVHHMIAERIGRDSITIVKNDMHILPLFLEQHEKLLIIAPKYEALTQVEEFNGEDDVLIEMIKIRHNDSCLHRIELSPTVNDKKIFDDLEEYHRIIMLTYNAHLNEAQADFVGKLCEKRNDTVIVAIRNPFDLACVKGAQTTVATYGFRSCSIKGLVEVLFGEIEAKGIMPVELDISQKREKNKQNVKGKK